MSCAFESIQKGLMEALNVLKARSKKPPNKEADFN